MGQDVPARKAFLFDGDILSRRPQAPIRVDQEQVYLYQLFTVTQDQVLASWKGGE
jgi:hypothetical protein